jgi:hypothetical protein
VESHLLAGWDNFYVIVGSAGAGLTGLTFVVIALMSESRRVNPAAVRAYVTPTVVYFSSVLALSAFLTIPHQGPSSLGIGFLVGGAAGVIYAGGLSIGLIRSDRSVYSPVGEDWIFHVILPLTAYAALLIAGVLCFSHPSQSLLLVATASLVLLFTGIHNTWDTAVWIRTQGSQSSESTATPK